MKSTEQNITSEYIHSYAHNAGKKAKVHYPKSIEELQGLVSKTTSFSIIGGRNSFGDIFIPQGEEVIDITAFDKIISFDEDTELVRVESGVRSNTLTLFLLSKGYYLPACSGSLSNTVAGDISSNINGKDSWKYGNYYHNVVSFKLLKANGEIILVDKGNPELFNSVIGGLGMLGIITEVTLKAQAIGSTTLLKRTHITKNIFETADFFSKLDETKTDFCYAWVDAVASEPRYVGRSVIEVARFDEHGEQTSNIRELVAKKNIYGLPDDVFWFMIRNTWSLFQKLGVDKTALRTLNGMRYDKLSRRNGQIQKVDFIQYQFPMMNELPNWNKRFIVRGVQEIQCLFSLENFEKAFHELLRVCKTHNMYPELCAIRRHKADDGYLSFSMDGLSVTVNYDRNNRSDDKLYKFEREIVATVIKHQGRIYLSKFPYLTKEECEAMYPDLPKFREVKKLADPNNVFATRTSERLL